VHPEHDRLTLKHLVGAGLRRSPWRSATGLLAALVAGGALFATLLLLLGMERLVASDLRQLGADLVLVPKGQAAVVRGMLTTGQAAEPLPAAVDVAAWKRQLKEGKVVGIKQVEGWSLAQGGAGEPATGKASVVFVHLERWASPLIAVQEVMAAVPEADVVPAEQATRQVARNLQPMVRLLGIAAVIALTGTVLLSGLLASTRVQERRHELGMLRAIGATRSFLVGLTLGETGLPALAGALGGLLLGLGVAALPGFAREAAGTLGGGEITLLAAATLAGTLLITVVAALGPALRAGRMDLLDAIRKER
jgi:putative ABC transport system permease protein